MAKIKVGYLNILEGSTITVTSENASYPKTRLCDRDIGKLFKASAFNANYGILTSQVVSNILEVDRLVIPAGHNLSGLPCALYYSTDNFVSDSHLAVSWTQGDALIIDKSFTAQTKQYWDLTVTAPATIVEMPELFLTKANAFDRNPSFGSTIMEKKNIQRDETQSGKMRRIKLGEPRLSEVYNLIILTAQKTVFEAWDYASGGTKSVYVWNEDGTIHFMELLNDIKFSYRANGIWETTLELLEVL